MKEWPSVTEHIVGDEFYTVAQAARLLGVSPATVWRWIVAGKLPAYRVGPRRIRIRKEDLGRVITPARRQDLVPAVGPEQTRRDIFATYDVRRVEEALRLSAGALVGIDRRQLLGDLRKARGQDSRGRPA
jgi:excisionase family DNA binding protein